MSFSKTAPENFDVVEVRTVSITVEWDINNAENPLDYKLDYRIQGSDDWKELILSTNDISINEKRRHVYKHQDLSPGTYYEIRMCSIHDNVKGEYTKPMTRKTLQIGKITFAFTLVDFFSCLIAPLFYFR